MDPAEELERLIQEMEWGQVLDTFQDALEEILGDALNPQPQALPAEQGFDINPQPVESLGGGYDGCNFPSSFEQTSVPTAGLNAVLAAPSISQEPLHAPCVMQSGHLYNQAGVNCQGQYLPCQWPVNVPGAAAVNAPPQQYNIVQMAGPPQSIEGNLVPAGTVNGEMAYWIPAGGLAPSASAAPPLNIPVSTKRQCESQQNEDRPYVKKPPNAFMVFRREQRPKVVAELNIRESGIVNTVLGQRWKLLSKEEQARYYEEAEMERRLHAQQFPDWSSRDNYGKKRKRIRSKAPNRAEASASVEVTHQAKKLRVTEVQTAVMEPSGSQTVAMGAPHSETGGVKAPTPLTVLVLEDPHSQTSGMNFPTRQTVRVKLHHMDTPVTVPVCGICNLPNVDELYGSWSPGIASTSRGFPAASASVEVTHQAKKLLVTAVQTAVMEPSGSQTVAIGAPHSETGGVKAPTPLTVLVLEDPHSQTSGMNFPTRQTVQMKLHHMDTPVTVPVCGICNLPNVDELYGSWSPGIASTSRGFPAASASVEVTHQVKKLRVTEMQTAVMEPSGSQTVAMGAPHSETGGVKAPTPLTVLVLEDPHSQTSGMNFPTRQTVQMKLHHMDTPVTVPVCGICNLPNVDELYGSWSPGIASTSRGFPAASASVEVTHQAKKLRVTEVQTAVMEPSGSQTVAMGAPHSETGGVKAPTPLTVLVLEDPHSQTSGMNFPTRQTVRVKLHHMDTPVTVPVCGICNLPNVDELYGSWSPGTASKSCVSLADVF